MSKRYGRNQKRKARAQLSAAQQQAHIWQTRYEDMQNTTADIRASWQHVKEVIRSSVPATTLVSSIALGVPFSGGTPRGENCGLQIPVRSTDAVLADFETRPESSQMRIIDLYGLLTRVRDTPFRDQLVVEVRYRDGIAAYALSPGALDAAPEDWLAGRVARDLVRELRRHRSK